MKLTKTRLKEIINEEIYNAQEGKLSEQDQQQNQANQEEAETVTVLRKSLKDFATDAANFKGLDPAEVQGLANIFKLIFTAAQQKSVGALLKRLSDIIGKKVQ